MQILQAMHWNPHNRSPGGAPGTPLSSSGGVGDCSGAVVLVSPPAGNALPRPPHSNPGWGPLVEQNKNVDLQHFFFYYFPPPKEEGSRQLSETPGLEPCLQSVGVLPCRPS